jgi:HEAT repeat protein
VVALIGLAATCGALVWAARGVRDRLDPVPALIAALKDPRPDVRTNAAVRLGFVASDPRSAGADTIAASTRALETALKDPSDQVRGGAAYGLGRIGTAGPPPAALLAALDGDASAGVRHNAAEALGEFQSGHDQNTLALLRALGKDVPNIRDACDSSLRRLLFRRNPNEERVSAAIVPALMEALTSRDLRVRYYAAAALGEVGAGAGASIPALIGMLNEPPDSDMVRTAKLDPGRWDPAGQAAVALGEIAPTTPQAGEAATALVAVIRRAMLERRQAPAAEAPPQSSIVRGVVLDWRPAMAAGALARFSPDLTAPALPLLLDLLKETAGQVGPPAPSVCAAIGQAAPGTPRADEAIEALSAALDSTWEYTRAEAAAALAKFGPRARSALPRLRALEKTDPKPSVRNTASSAALRIEGASSNGTPE